jgi:hypothetical protein
VNPSGLLAILIRRGEVLPEGRTLEDEVRLIGEGKVKTV